MAKTIDQIANEEIEKQNRRDAEFGYLSGVGQSSDQPDENLATAQDTKSTDADAIVTPSLERVIETGFDYNAAVNEINEEYKDLQERIDKPGPFTLTEIQPGDYQLQQEKTDKIRDAKLKYVESKVGAPVNNHNEMGFWISTLLQRYKTPEVKENAFKYFYPDGDMMEVPIVGTDGKKKVISIYRRNQDEEYGLLYPMGRDVNEFGVVGAELLSFRTAAATLAFLADPFKMPAVAAGVGDYMGIKVDKLANWGLGKALGFEGGEGEFYKVDKLSDLKLTEFSPLQFGEDKGYFGVGMDEDVFGAALTTLFTKGIGIGTNLLTGQSKPTLIPMTNEIIKIAKELDLPPAVIAQMAANPLIQKMFFRAGDITGWTTKKTLPQRAELYNKFKAYGIGMKNADDVAAIEKSINAQYLNGDFGKKGSIEAIGAKNKALNKALKDASETNQITWQDWSDLVEIQTQKLAEAMKPFRMVGDDGVPYYVTPTEGYVALKEAFKQWDEVITKGIDKTRAGAINNSAGVSYAIGGKDSLKGLINELETGTGVFQGSGASNVGGVGTSKFFNEAGELVTSKIAIDLTKKSNKPLLELINDIKALDDVIINPKTNTPNLGAIKGKNSQWDAFSQLEVLRSKAFTLMSNDDAAVREAGRKIHQKIINIMEDNSGKFKSGGSSKYDESMSLYLKNIKEYEEIVGLKDMMTAMSNKIDPEQFASKYFQPGSGYNLTLLKNQLGPDNVNWTTFEKSFKASLLRDPSNIKSTIKQWQTKDPDGLKTLLDDTEIEDLIKLGDTAETMNNSIVIKAFENQSSNTVANTRELVNTLLKQAEGKNLGDAKIIEKFIQSSGGMDGKVMNNVRSGIIEDILNRSSVVDTKTGSLVIKPKTLMAELKKLGDDPHLKMFFTPENLSTLGKFELYTNVIGASSDFGGQLAAAELGTEVTKSLLDPSKILPTLKTMLTFDITARILGRDVTPKMLENLFKPGLNTSVNFTAIRSMLGSIMGEFMEGDYEQQREIDIKDDVPDGVFSGNRDYLENFPSNPNSPFATTTSRIEMLQEMENIKEDENRALESSSLGNVNMGFRNVGLNNRANTMERGQQLFKNDITFAAKGGIMNTTKAFQRVA
jgi:hypothetical protein